MFGVLGMTHLPRHPVEPSKTRVPRFSCFDRTNQPKSHNGLSARSLGMEAGCSIHCVERVQDPWIELVCITTHQHDQWAKTPRPSNIFITMFRVLKLRSMRWLAPSNFRSLRRRRAPVQIASLSKQILCPLELLSVSWWAWR